MRRSSPLFCALAVATAACGLELDVFGPPAEPSADPDASSSGAPSGSAGSSSGAASSSGQGEPNLSSSSGDLSSSSSSSDELGSSSSGEPSSSSGGPSSSSSSGAPSSSSGGPVGLCLPEINPYAFATLPLDDAQFTHDVVAEDASPRATTTSALDDANYVLFSESYAQLRVSSPSPLRPNYQSATHTFALQPFDRANAIHVAHDPPDASVTVQLPANTGRALSLLGFSAQGASALRITLNYADGSAPTTLEPFTLRDWYTDDQGIAKFSGFDRVRRNDDLVPYLSTRTNRGPNLYVVDLVKPYARCASPVASIRIERVADRSDEAARAWLFAIAASE